MKIDVNRLKKALPLVKEYASGRGINLHQKFPDKNDTPVYGNAISAIIRNNELLRTNSGSSYCYYSLMCKVKYDDVILLQVQPPNEDQNEEAFRQYIDWVVNISPWRHVFISKNINRIIKGGVVVVHRNNYSKAYLREACIALRMAWENYYGNKKYREVDVWWDVAQKVNPNLAYIATKAMTKPMDSDSSIIILKGSDTGHAPINYYQEKDNFHFNGWLRGSLTTRGWSSSSRTKPPVIKSIMEIINQIGSDGRPVNPFNNNRLSKCFKRQAFIEAMQSELPKLESEYV